MPKHGWVDRGECPECGSSDAKVKHSDGHSFCFSCNTYFKDGDEMQQEAKVLPMERNMKSKGQISSIDDRRINYNTCKKYNTFINKSGNTITHHVYQYFDKKGNHIGNKIREVADKKFYSEGNISDALLFGQNLFKKGGRYITVCEGEIDAMSVFQMLGSKGNEFPVVSIKNGVASAFENCKQSLDYLEGFDNIVLCFDNDKVGREAALKTAQLFEPNKCKILTLDHKDPNEYLKMGQGELFYTHWWNAKTYTPAGIVNLHDLGDSLYDETFCETCLYPWSKLNEKTYGMRTGELVTFTSGAGMGKSSIMRELMHHVMMDTNDNIGVLALEESVRNTAFNIMSVEADARLYIKEIRDQFTAEQLKDWQKKTIGTKRFFAFDHFGSIENKEILDRVRYMAKALDCKWIILDHLSILVSGQEDIGDERKSIDVLMTKLRSLVEETGIALLLVSHLRRPAGDRGHEDGKEVSLSHLRGSASIAHLSDSVIALERNQQAQNETEANTTTVRILKNRYTGDTGVACHLHYNRETGRLTQVDNPFMEEEQ
tara:strand:+ start:953 stop:2584 length:1632 start_codon:yes stop_codon:yes gene_type:complete